MFLRLCVSLPSCSSRAQVWAVVLSSASAATVLIISFLVNECTRYESHRTVLLLITAIAWSRVLPTTPTSVSFAAVALEYKDQRSYFFSLWDQFRIVFTFSTLALYFSLQPRTTLHFASFCLALELAERSSWHFSLSRRHTGLVDGALTHYTYARHRETPWELPAITFIAMFISIVCMPTAIAKSHDSK